MIFLFCFISIYEIFVTDYGTYMVIDKIEAEIPYAVRGRQRIRIVCQTVELEPRIACTVVGYYDIEQGLVDFNLTR